ncbi:hypothetical protein BDP27DRAFT_1431637 [Rhodocollybia butyracea]|uniref:Novel STAND NTPase 1 domain-containing protein n=1 Tax=Rhodocollybia butyracea TaxID=206335 RepID=A0A9P5P5G7_9AGAR|nr:hypothetical protein BDP27DRAFT_1431637 [Rhodocollybia butyracea]
MTKRKEHKAQNEHDGLGAPSKSEHARETGKTLLDVLEMVAEQIPVPGVAIAIKLAKNLIQMCEDSHATLEQAEILKKRIKNLAIILVNELKGKKAEEIEEKLRKDIEQLASDLKYIQSKLEEIAAQNTFRVILYRKLNEDKVRGCVERLATALESFNLSRQIADANALDHLFEQIITFYKQEQVTLDEIQRSTKNIEKEFKSFGQNIESVHAMLAEKKYQGDGSDGSSPRRGVIPVAPSIFFGRDTIVNDFACTLVSQETTMARICLLGPGGMGKTSIARAVLHHPSVVKYFGEENRVWVPCVKATSVSLLQDTLYDSLGVSLSTGDPLHDVINDLNSSKSPIILLLDNFETPWNIRGKQSEVQEILLQLAKLQHVALFVTMRSFNAPGDGIHWESIHLDAVDKEASACIYAEIHSTGSKDPGLSSLLDEVGHMPLATTLMAKLGQTTGYSPAELLELYKDAGTALLNLGEESQRSMDICINLSIKSQPMIDSPGADKILAILALLPAGTTSKALSQWWANDIPKATIALGLRTLLVTSLVEKRADTFFLLPVIRRYVLDPIRFTENIRASTVQKACVFLKEHNKFMGESNYLAHKNARSLEEVNLQGILLETTVADPDTIEALLILSEHQPEAEALNQFRLAREVFLQVSEPKRAAYALYWIGTVPFATLGRTSADEFRYLRDALTEFQSLDEPKGIAQCQIALSMRVNAESMRTLTETREFCISNNLPLEQATCTQHLTELYSTLNRLDEAAQWGLIALEEAKQIDIQTHGILWILGTVWISLVGTGLDEERAKRRCSGAFMETLKYCELLQASHEGEQFERACNFFLARFENPSMKPNFWEWFSLMQLNNLGAREDYDGDELA